MTEQFKLQKIQLEQALYYANVIEDCDEKIEKIIYTNLKNYFRNVRYEAIEKYADAVGKIIESSIDIAENFQAKSISDNLFETIGTITKQYAIQKGINLK